MPGCRGCDPDANFILTIIFNFDLLSYQLAFGGLLMIPAMFPVVALIEEAMR